MNRKDGVEARRRDVDCDAQRNDRRDHRAGGCARHRARGEENDEAVSAATNEAALTINTAVRLCQESESLGICVVALMINVISRRWSQPVGARFFAVSAAVLSGQVTLVTRSPGIHYFAARDRHLLFDQRRGRPGGLPPPPNACLGGLRHCRARLRLGR